MRYCILLIFLLLLQSCATANRPLTPDLQAPPADGTPIVYTATIKDASRVRFNGLLALSRQNGGLHYILLDATGITLLESRIDTRGEAHHKRLLGPLKTNMLPGFLATAIKRIFLVQPIQTPCEQHFLATLCDERVSPDSRRKWLHTGPFTWWTVQFSNTAGKNREQSLEYAHFLSGITLYLSTNPPPATRTQ